MQRCYVHSDSDKTCSCPSRIGQTPELMCENRKLHCGDSRLTIAILNHESYHLYLLFSFAITLVAAARIGRDIKLAESTAVSLSDIDFAAGGFHHLECKSISLLLLISFFVENSTEHVHCIFVVHRQENTGDGVSNG